MVRRVRVAVARIAGRTVPPLDPAVAEAVRWSRHCVAMCAEKHWQGHGCCPRGRGRCQRGLLQALVAGAGWAKAAPRPAAAVLQSAAEVARAAA